LGSIPLETPTTALPGSITDTTNAADVTTPNGDVLPPTVGTTPSEGAGDVLPPQEITPPDIGTSPSDSPTDVSIPQDLIPTVPPLGGDVPAPIETVVPPVGWSPETGDISAYDLQDFLDWLKSIDKPKNIAERVEQQLDEQEADIEGVVIGEIARQAAWSIPALATEKLGGEYAAKIENINVATKDWTPRARAKFYFDLGFEISMADTPERQGQVRTLIDTMDAKASDARKANETGETTLYDDQGRPYDPNLDLQGILSGELSTPLGGERNPGMSLGDALIGHGEVSELVGLRLPYIANIVSASYRDPRTITTLGQIGLEDGFGSLGAAVAGALPGFSNGVKSKPFTIDEEYFPTVPNSPTGNPPASAPHGRRGDPIAIPRGTNSPTVINGREYSGHALDQMQGRGVPPSAVEEAINYGNPTASRGSTMQYLDIQNGVKVVTNSQGKVITVITTSEGR
jgi:hypothetical protein